MRIDVVHDGITHSGDVSWWNGQARSRCGKKFAAGKFRETLFRGSVNCPDCKSASNSKKKP